MISFFISVTNNYHKFHYFAKIAKSRLTMNLGALRDKMNGFRRGIKSRVCHGARLRYTSGKKPIDPGLSSPLVPVVATGTKAYSL
jgi:hypothetical protein